MPQKNEEAGRAREVVRGKGRVRQLRPNLGLNLEKIYEYKNMIDDQFRRYGPTKSIIRLKTKKGAATPLIAGIDSNNWDVDFIIDEKLKFRESPDLLRYMERRNVVDPVKELLRAVAYHEMGHWEFPRGTQFGCPYDKPTYYASFIEPIYEELGQSGKGFGEGFRRQMSARIANAVMDVIDNYNVAGGLAKMNEQQTGQTLFWYLQGQEAGKYDGEYTMFVRLNLALFGQRDDVGLLKQFFQKNSELDQSVQHLEKIFTQEMIYSKEKWELLAREYTKEAIKQMKANETPRHQHSPDDRTAKGRKERGEERGKEERGESSSDGTQKKENGEEEDGEGEGKGSSDGMQEEEDGEGSNGAGKEDGDSEDNSKGASGGMQEEKDGEGEGKGSSDGMQEEEDGEGENGSGEQGKEGGEKKGGAAEEESEDNEDLHIGFGGIVPGSDLSPEDIEKIMGGRGMGAIGGGGMGQKGIPFYIKSDDALDAYYRYLAKRIPLKADGGLPKGDFPLIAQTRERFDPEMHSLEDADAGRLHFDPVSRTLSPSFVKTRIKIGIPIRKEKRGMPDFMFSLIDSSGSMMSGGDRTVVPWGNDSYYHYALLTFWGLLRFFEMERILHKIDVSAAIFSSGTLDTKGLGDVKKMLLNPTTGGTEIDMEVVLAHMRGKQNAVFSFITDGDIYNWGSVKEEFIEVAKRNQFFMIQVGGSRSVANELRERGFEKQVYFVDFPKDIVNLAIDLTAKKYYSAIESRAEKEKRMLAKEFK